MAIYTARQIVYGVTTNIIGVVLFLFGDVAGKGGEAFWAHRHVQRLRVLLPCRSHVRSLRYEKAARAQFRQVHGEARARSEERGGYDDHHDIEPFSMKHPPHHQQRT